MPALEICDVGEHARGGWVVLERNSRGALHQHRGALHQHHLLTTVDLAEILAAYYYCSKFLSKGPNLPGGAGRGRPAADSS